MGFPIEEIDLLGSGTSSRGHGTAIASIISGNDSGIMGIAPSASFFPFVYWMAKGRRFIHRGSGNRGGGKSGCAGDQS